MHIRLLDKDEYHHMLPLLTHYYTHLTQATLEDRLQTIKHTHYQAAGVFDDHQTLIAISGFWLTTRFYSGKQMELDNFIVDDSYQRQGIGKQLLAWLQQYAKSIDCESIELNSYVHNTKSHRFYFNQEFSIIGYHFEKSCH